MMELGASHFQVCTLRRKGRKAGETGTLGGALLAVKAPENGQRAVTDRRRVVTPEPKSGVIHVANTLSCDRSIYTYNSPQIMNTILGYGRGSV